MNEVIEQLDHRSVINSFSEQVNTQVQDILLNVRTYKYRDTERLDLTNLKTYTIDDPEAEEIDDAISLEQNDGINTIWIHIADPTNFIQENTAIDLEARSRATSIYLVDKIIPMIPKELTIKTLNLTNSKECYALSAGIKLNEDGSVIESFLSRSIIKPTYRLTYQDAEDLIDLAPKEENDLALLNQLLRTRSDWRKKNGALFIEAPEGKYILNQDTLCIRITDNTKSRLLIKEAMILMGSVVAQYGVEHNLPLPYRGQLNLQIPNIDSLNAFDNINARNAFIRTCLFGAQTSIKPAPHKSLGLNSYVQSTSPIRRYNDIIVHRQITNHLDNKPTYTDNELQILLDKLARSIDRANERVKSNNDFYQQEWFKSNKNKIVTGYFLRWINPLNKIALIYINQLCMICSSKVLKPNNPQPGLNIKMIIKSNDIDRQNYMLVAD